MVACQPGSGYGEQRALRDPGIHLMRNNQLAAL